MARPFVIYGQKVVFRRNPWEVVGLAKKPIIMAKAPPWSYSKARASQLQKTIWENLARTARELYSEYEATGRREDQVKVIKEIGNRLRGKLAAEIRPELKDVEIARLKARLPKRAKISPAHPIVQKLRKLGATVELG